MRHGPSHRRASAGAVAALVLVGTVAVAQPAAAAAPTRTVATVAELRDELAAPAATVETIVLGTDLTSVPSTAATSKASSALTIDLAGHGLALGSLVVGGGASLRITDSTASGGTLTVDGTAPGGGLVDTPVRVPNGTTLTVDGTARVTATGGRSSAVIGSRGAPDPYGGAGEIDVLGHAVVDVRGSSTGSGSTARTSSGIGGPLASIHIGEHAVVRVVGTSAGAALGGGSGGVGGDSSVLIDGDAVVDASTVGSGGAAIGSAAGISANRLTTVTITDRATVTATGGPYAPGIGNGGASSTRTTVAIGGGATVTARGGTSAAGIGGGVGTAVGGDGADVTIGAGAAVTAAGGSAADTAIGSGSGRAAASPGTLTNAGRLTIPAGSSLRIPAGATVVNSGTITTSGPISGAGAIRNGGTVATTGADGSLDPATSITGDRWAIAFDPGTGTPTGPTSLRLAADSIRAAGISAPLPSPAADQVVAGWNTAADGSGRYVDDTTDLRTVATAASPSGSAVRLALHAVLLARTDAVPVLPAVDLAPATDGGAYAASVRALRGFEPIGYRIAAGSLPPGLALDPGTGAITGTPRGVQGSRVTVEASNRFGADSREYRVDVVAPPAAPAPAPTAAPQASPEVAAPQATASSEHGAAAAVGSAEPQPTAVPLPPQPAALSRSRLPVGGAVQQAVGVPGTALAVTAGALPPGLRIDREHAVVQGVPTRPGRYRFTLSAMTAGGSVERTYSLVVVAPLAVEVDGATEGGRLPLVAGARATVVVRGLLPGERYAVRWAGRVVARGTSRSARAVLRVRVPDRAGLRQVRVRAADHAGADAGRAVESLPTGDVLAVAAPAGVQANRALAVRVRGLAPGEPVQVRYEGRTVSPAGARADRDGEYRLRTSAGWSWGWKPIEVRGLTGRTGATRVAVLPRRD